MSDRTDQPMQVLLTIKYVGSDYSGWQSQPSGDAVQDKIARAVCRMTGVKVMPVAASRTDAGVHALAQLAQLELPSIFPFKKIKPGLNAYLEPDIRISSVEKMPDDFKIRKAAFEKEYAYFVIEGEEKPFFSKRAWGIRAKLDPHAIRSAMKFIQGRHDFKSFRATGCSRKSTVCHIRDAKLSRVRSPFGAGVYFWKFSFVGDAFLRHMIRNIVGLLVEVGLQKRSAADVKKILHARDRTTSGICAPAHGLYLIKVKLKR